MRRCGRCRGFCRTWSARRRRACRILLGVSPPGLYSMRLALRSWETRLAARCVVLTMHSLPSRWIRLDGLRRNHRDTAQQDPLCERLAVATVCPPYLNPSISSLQQNHPLSRLMATPATIRGEVGGYIPAGQPPQAVLEDLKRRARNADCLPPHRFHETD